MRTTLTLDDDVGALIESERSRTGESFRAAVNRLIRRGAAAPASTPPPLPIRQGRPRVGLGDVSAVFAALDDERRSITDIKKIYG
jgi:hypothetical protein